MTLTCAVALVAAGFAPDTISSDNHVQVPVPPPPAQPHDLALTMSKLAAAGLEEDEVFKAVTATPVFAQSIM
jgi:predicted amidohydrolase